MIRAISYKLPNKWSNLLVQVFDEVPVEDYDWQLRDMDVYIHPYGSGWLFNHETYNGCEFKRLVECNKYYILALGLIASTVQSDEKVHDLESFSQSTANFALLIYDSIYVQVYVKDDEMYEMFHRAAIKHEFSSIRELPQDEFWHTEWTA